MKFDFVIGIIWNKVWPVSYVQNEEKEGLAA